MAFAGGLAVDQRAWCACTERTEHRRAVILPPVRWALRGGALIRVQTTTNLGDVVAGGAGADVAGKFVERAGKQIDAGMIEHLPQAHHAVTLES